MSHAIYNFIIVEKNLDLIKKFERMKELGLYSPRSRNLVYAGERFSPIKELKDFYDMKSSEWCVKAKIDIVKESEKNWFQGFSPSPELKAFWDKMEEWGEKRKSNTDKVSVKNGILTVWMRLPKE